ncbi:hypothetical protein LZ31DRAFT_376753 [Colletotrichum somersetense]|nr:hypothetical protein LZ31DRAFT_376753 [Colletotrichum somersetense]
MCAGSLHPQSFLPPSSRRLSVNSPFSSFFSLFLCSVRDFSANLLLCLSSQRPYMSWLESKPADCRHSPFLPSQFKADSGPPFNIAIPESQRIGSSHRTYTQTQISRFQHTYLSIHPSSTSSPSLHSLSPVVRHCFNLIDNLEGGGKVFSALKGLSTRHSSPHALVSHLFRRRYSR